MLSISPPRHVEGMHLIQAIRAIRGARTLGAPEAAKRFSLQQLVSIVIFIVSIHRLNMYI